MKASPAVPKAGHAATTELASLCDAHGLILQRQRCTADLVHPAVQPRTQAFDLRRGRHGGYDKANDCGRRAWACRVLLKTVIMLCAARWVHTCGSVRMRGCTQDTCTLPSTWSITPSIRCSASVCKCVENANKEG